MEFGVPLERRPDEFRVGLAPQGAALLTQMGHRVYVEKGAGKVAGFDDESYVKAGARIVYNPDEVYGRADVVLKIGAPAVQERDWLKPGQTIAAFWHLAARSRELNALITQQGITALAYEMIQNPDGGRPVLYPLSQIAGRMAPQIAARFLQNDGGGQGRLLSGIPGVPPLDVIILGAGIVGLNAARTFLGLGSRVIMLDNDLSRLQHVDRRFRGAVTTMFAHEVNIARVAAFADVLIGAAAIGGERSPHLVSREVVRSMRARSVILDISIDQGGSVETSRPTRHSDPVFIEENVIHYCVPNMSSVVARTASYAFGNAAWPFVKLIAEHGVEGAAASTPALMHGLPILAGKVQNPSLAALLEEV